MSAGLTLAPTLTLLPPELAPCYSGSRLMVTKWLPSTPDAHPYSSYPGKGGTLAPLGSQNAPGFTLINSANQPFSGTQKMLSSTWSGLSHIYP